MAQLLQGKLTKKFLIQLQEGCYLMSNLIDNYNCPIYEGAVMPQDMRDAQWVKIRQAGAAQNTCRVFKTKSEYVRWVDAVKVKLR